MVNMFLIFLSWVQCLVVIGVTGRNLMENAPQMCPIEHNNLIDVQLFVSDEEECFKLCEKSDKCKFFRFYASSFTRPSQCFLFKSCGRQVEDASPDCMLNKENTVEVKPFIKSHGECKQLCQGDRRCAYFKYQPRAKPRTGDPDLPPAINPLLNQIGTNQEEFCFILRSCSKRMVDNVQCALGKNNFLDVKFFVESTDECKIHCQATNGCRYYWWYPLDYSESPAYCYMFQQCAPKDKEPEVALIIGGRHPGHYFMTQKQHNDLIMRNDVCMLETNDNVSLARAGAISQFVGDKVLYCGGRNGHGVHTDCLAFHPKNNTWAHHSNMVRAREEATSVVIGTAVFVMGGIDEKTVEVINLKSEIQGSPDIPEWKLGPDLPQVLGRSCAVLMDNETVIIAGGHDDNSTLSLATGYMLNILENAWTEIPNMKVPRRDHACLFVEFEKSKGMLVTGGLGENDEVLDSAEFFDLATNEWILTSGMKVGRTEHAMSLIYGIPTVIGGLSNSGFLTSIEQFDKSSASWNVPLERDWRIVNNALGAPRYEMTSASIPVSLMETHENFSHQVQNASEDIQRTRVKHQDILELSPWNLLLIILAILLAYWGMNLVCLCLAACLIGHGSKKRPGEDGLDQRDFERSSIYKVVNGVLRGSLTDFQSSDALSLSESGDTSDDVLGTVEVHSTSTILSVVPKGATPSPNSSQTTTIGLGHDFFEMSLPNVTNVS
ncbi:hypothetical protein TCAL_07513 [Tigriopus californicus]|uniref:Apple domain-containing protein n=1 Tax=Tigriopus californicus TaxID=6832 RepID=A0A553PB68_TIGCA|nr:hypothetical protein TCAL_07513 [Tigriopus californicus]